MEQQAVHDPQREEALARSTLYRFLSVAFLPSGEALETLAADADTLASVQRASGHLAWDEAGMATEEACRLLTGTDGASLNDEYHRIFGHHAARDCPVCETEYGAGHVFQQAQQLADIAGFYLAFGLEVADGVGERVDHISLELEFMHVLAFREAYARIHHGAEEVALLRDAQRAFLQDHLGRWVSAFARLVSRKTEGFYLRLARLAAAYIQSDAASFGLRPADDTELAPPVSMDPEESVLPCGADRCPLYPELEPQP